MDDEGRADIKALIVDGFGVMLDIEPGFSLTKNVADYLNALPKSQRKWVRRVTPAYVGWARAHTGVAFETGKVSRKQRLESMASRLRIRLTNEQLEELDRLEMQWFANACYLLPGAISMVGKLQSEDYKVALCSNHNPNGVAAFHRLGLYQLLDAVVVSCDEDVETLKPDPKIYHVAADRLDLSLNQCAFADDSIRPLQGAWKAGANEVYWMKGTYPEQRIKFKPKRIKSVTRTDGLANLVLPDAG